MMYMYLLTHNTKYNPADLLVNHAAAAEKDGKRASPAAVPTAVLESA